MVMNDEKEEYNRSHDGMIIIPRAQKCARITSKDWPFIDDENQSSEDPLDLSFNDNCSEDDPDTSALIMLKGIDNYCTEMSEYSDKITPCNEKEAHGPTMNEQESDSALPHEHKDQDIETIAPTSIIEPTELDVLLGRGGLTNKHAGNKRYREEVEKAKPMYHACKSKEEKKSISELVVEWVHEYGGRFLERKNSNSNIWIQASPKVARKKASQALRERWRENCNDN